MPLLTTETETFTLTVGEADALAGYLKLMNNPEEWARYFTMDLNHALGKTDRGPLGPDVIADALLDGLDHESREAINGLLYVGNTGTVHPLVGFADPGEADELECYLKLSRSNYWLYDFIRPEVSIYAEGKRRTPAQALKNLEQYIENFACDVAAADAMIQNHPDLLTMPKAEPAAAEPKEETQPEEQPASPHFAPKKPSRKAKKAPLPRNRTRSTSQPQKAKKAA